MSGERGRPATFSIWLRYETRVSYVKIGMIPDDAEVLALKEAVLQVGEVVGDHRVDRRGRRDLSAWRRAAAPLAGCGGAEERG